MNSDKLLSALVVRILNNQRLEDEFGSFPVIKGPRKPSTASNPAFTAHVLSKPKNPDSESYNGTLVINGYSDNYSNGNANSEELGLIEEVLVEEFHDNPPAIADYRIFNFAVEEPLGPLFNSEYPDEHFISIRISFSLIKE